MRETLIITFLVLSVLLFVYLLCKCVWVAGNARGFGEGYKAKEKENNKNK